MTHSMHPIPGGLGHDDEPGRRSRWHAIYPWILAGLAVLTLVLGTIGYHQYLPTLETYTTPAASDDAGRTGETTPAPVRPHGPHLWVNSLYFTVQLFALHSGFYHNFVDQPPGPALQIARWTAALASFGAIGYALTAFLLHWLGVIRIRRWKQHYVVCGLGHWTVALLTELRKGDKKVLVIEKNPSDELIPTCTQLKIPVLIGDATTEAILEEARIRHAAGLIAFSNDDGTNIEITLAARKLQPATSADRRPLTCYTHVVDRELMMAIEQHETLAEPGGAMDVQLFNSYENAARQAVADAISHVTPEQLDAIDTVHLIVLGLSAMGESVVLQAVRNCHFKPGREFRITLVEPNQQAVEAFLARYPALPELCEFRPEIGTGTEPTIRALIETAVRDQRQLVVLAVCFEGDQRSLDAVLRLPRAVTVRRVPVYLRLSSPGGLATLVAGGAAPDSGLPGEIRPFGLPKQCGGPDAIMRPEVDAVARAIHDAYRIERLGQELKKNGRSIAPDIVRPPVHHEKLEPLISEHFDLRTELAMLPWERLPEGFRNSNRLQADHIPVKLLSVGWYAADRPASSADTLVDFSQRTDEHRKEVDLLAEIEHRRWIAERRLAGWVRGGRNPALRQSPYLIPWSDLAENIKDYDRQVVEALPRQLDLRGLRLYRRPRPGR